MLLHLGVLCGLQDKNEHLSRVYNNWFEDYKLQFLLVYTSLRSHHQNQYKQYQIAMVHGHLPVLFAQEDCIWLCKWDMFSHAEKNNLERQLHREQKEEKENVKGEQCHSCLRESQPNNTYSVYFNMFQGTQCPMLQSLLCIRPWFPDFIIQIQRVRNAWCKAFHCLYISNSCKQIIAYITAYLNHLLCGCSCCLKTTKQKYTDLVVYA